MPEFLKFRANDPMRWRVYRIALFYQDASELMQNATLVHVQGEEARLGLPSHGGKVKPVVRRYDTFEDLPPERQELYRQYTAHLEKHYGATGIPATAMVARTAKPKSSAKRKTARVIGGSATIFRDVRLGDGPAGVPCPGEFRPEEWGETIRVDLRRYPHAAFALRIHGHSMTGVGIQDQDIVVFALPDPAEDLAGRVVAACIDGEATVKTLVRRNGKTILRAENPAYPDPIVTKNSSVQGVAVGKPIRQKRPVKN